MKLTQAALVLLSFVLASLVSVALGRPQPQQHCDAYLENQSAVAECVGVGSGPAYQICFYIDDAGNEVSCCVLERAAMNWKICHPRGGSPPHVSVCGIKVKKFYKIRAGSCVDSVDEHNNWTSRCVVNAWVEADPSSDHFEWHTPLASCP